MHDPRSVSDMGSKTRKGVFERILVEVYLILNDDQEVK
ncbi:hypothetical protein LEP1GSC036_2908 [Leptospira weilii str. 2006001853]|uniref:Uncharacterized protein n=1 Tax=Leptospira weilii str. 2006001853 TaxID=1001589 RepID=A0A828Z593_9LEPT|nr:hypothetical protein LEP1GSC036_2908 [Leptospira weilii str. 2006001853]EMJ63937.1 hypothetical protein LEP1GSC051_0546 [Leptospira sp. P2653]EMN43965.1 hypothetical protein LEP1GSC086_4405 [Leptospira weilii str. LNT 1234]